MEGGGGVKSLSMAPEVGYDFKNLLENYLCFNLLHDDCKNVILKELNLILKCITSYIIYYFIIIQKLKIYGYCIEIYTKLL